MIQHQFYIKSLLSNQRQLFHKLSICTLNESLKTILIDKTNKISRLQRKQLGHILDKKTKKDIDTNIKTKRTTMIK